MHIQHSPPGSKYNNGMGPCRDRRATAGGTGRKSASAATTGRVADARGGAGTETTAQRGGRQSLPGAGNNGCGTDTPAQKEWPQAQARRGTSAAARRRHKMHCGAGWALRRRVAAFLQKGLAKNLQAPLRRGQPSRAAKNFGANHVTPQNPGTCR